MNNISNTQEQWYNHSEIIEIVKKWDEFCKNQDSFNDKDSLKFNQWFEQFEQKKLMKKLTAVEWLVANTELNYYSDNDTLLAIEQAKEMEKLQVIEFGIWLHNKIFATYQVGGKYVGMWHAHIPKSNKDYFTSEEIVDFWKLEQKKYD